MLIEIQNGDSLKAVRDIYSDHEKKLVFEEGTLYMVNHHMADKGRAVCVEDEEGCNRDLGTDFIKENFRVVFHKSSEGPTLADKIKQLEDVANGMLESLKQLKDDNQIH
jgi:hypothetical protein